MPIPSHVRRSYLEAHIAIFIFGFTAILGALITLPTYSLVWWRLLFTSVSLLLFPVVRCELRTLDTKTIKTLVLIGAIIVFHWICFYGAIKYSNASITLICFATTAFFTAIVEPIFTKKPFRWHEILLGLLIVPGMALIVNYTPSKQYFGIFLGIVAAFTASIFATLNKKLMQDQPANVLTMTFVELFGGFVIFTPLFFMYAQYVDIQSLIPNTSDLIYLLLLSLVCTTLAYVLSFRSLKHLSAFTVSFMLNLEPIYGIILAWLILKENLELSPYFYLGATFILGTVFAYPLINNYFNKKPI